MKKRDVLGAVILGIVIWQVTVWLTNVPRFILPSPFAVAKTAYTSRALIAEHALVTATEVIIGLLIGSLFGIITALSLASSSLFKRLFLPILVFSQAVPVFALAPLLTLWFGYGIGSKIVMTVLIIFFPITSAFHDGLSRTPRGMLDMAQVLGATKWQIMRHIRIPAALPALGSGLKLAAVYAPIGAVIGEWVGSSNGLGYLMLLANGRVKTDLLFAALVALALFSMVLHFLLSRVSLKLEAYAKLNGQN